MQDNDILRIYELLTKDIEKNDDDNKLIERLSIIVEQIKLSHEYRDKLNELNKKLQGCDENAN